MRRTAITRTLLAAGLFAAAGCATGSANVETEPEMAAVDPEATIRFEVENDLVPPETVIVTFHAPGDVERVLGTVHPRETETFTVENRHAVPPYRLVAEGSSGQEIVSRSIDATTASGIRWELGTNFLRVEDEDVARR